MNSLSSFRKPDSFRSMGIEIECGIPYFKEEKPEKGTYLGFFYVTGDGSITVHGSDDYEFVSQPLPRDWLIKEVKRLEKKLGSWRVNTTCGIHIHVSRKWLNEAKAKLIHKFYGTLPWQERIELFGRDSNSYCRVGLDRITWDRYTAINLQNPNTIEFRMFASGDAEWAEYCIRMVDYLIKNAKHLNVDAAMAFRDSHHPDKKGKL